MEMEGMINSPLFPMESLSPENLIKLPSKPNAESGSVKLYLILAEPHLFLEGFTNDEVMARPPSILRGCIFLRILKPVKIKNIKLKLSAISRTDWPEGIPPKKTEYFESNSILNHTWPFFNYSNHYPITPTSRNNADIYIPRSEDELSSFSLDTNLSPVTSALDLNEIHPIKSPNSIMGALIGSKKNSSRSNLLKAIGSPSHSNNIDNELISLKSNSNDDNKYFPVGDYIYSFEMPIQASQPESINVTFGSVYYTLEAFLERSGTFKSNLSARKQIDIVRAPFEDSSEENEPIVIDRDWENRLQYDIVIYSKQVVLNSYLPISFRMTPLDKIKVHRLRVYITEHLDYYCHNKKVHRTEPPKKVLLLEHKPPEGSDNLLSLGSDEIGGVELDFQVYVPEYYSERFKLHPDTSSEDIQSHHWIKICIRLSKLEPTKDDPKKRKQYELSIDSPMHLLSPLCAHANTLLPSYDDQINLDRFNRQPNNTSIDKMMSPRPNTILHSNLFEPNDSVPVEMLSTQAKPFSPIASPQLNSINPELRSTPTLRPSDIFTSTRSRAGSITNSSVPLPKPHTRSVYEEPPPPFVENPPTYEDAIKAEGKKNRQRNQSITITPSSPVISANDLRGRCRHRERENTKDSVDLAEDIDLKFKITPIRSTSGSPTRSPNRQNSPKPILPQIRSKSKLVNSSFLPGFTYNSSSSSSHAIDAALAEANNGNGNNSISNDKTSSNTDSNTDYISRPSSATNTPKKLSPIESSSSKRKSSVSSASSENAFTPSLIDPDETLDLDDPLIRRPLLVDDINGSKISLTINDPPFIHGNGSFNTINNLQFRNDRQGSISTMYGLEINGDDVGVGLANVVGGGNEGTDITSMSMSILSSNGSPEDKKWTKMKNPRLVHHPQVGK